MSGRRWLLRYALCTMASLGGMLWVASCSTGAGGGGGGGSPPAGPTSEGGGGSTGFTLTGRQFSVPLGDVGRMEMNGSDAPAKTAAAIEIFSQTPTDSPSTCTLTIETRDCTLTGETGSQSIRVTVQVDAVTSTTPCDTGVEVGTFTLNHDGQSWSTDSAEIALSSAALSHVRSGQFTVCLSAYGGAGATLEIGEMTVAFTAGSTPPPAGDDDDDEVDEVLVTEIVAFQDSLDSYFEELDSLADTVGDEAAKAQMAATIAADPMVAWADVTPQGVTVQHVSGGGGILMLNPLRGADADTGDVLASAVSFRAAAFVASGVKPHVSKVLYLDSAYSEFKSSQDSLYAKWQASFPRIGTVTFDRYVDEQCTIDKYFGLDAYDFIYFGGHGGRWTNRETGKKEVYLLTRQPNDEAFIRQYHKEWAAGKWRNGGYKPRQGANKGTYFSVVWLGPSWLAAGLKTSSSETPKPLDLWGRRQLVWCSFCYSFLGSWQTVMVGGAGASGCFGYDGPIAAYRDAAIAGDMVQQMCDTTFSDPIEIGFWYDNADTTYETIKENDPADILDDEWQTVLLRYKGTPNVVFWEREEEEEPDPDCTVFNPELGSRRWHVRWQWDCDGVVSSDNLWHFHEDGTISDHWLGLIDDHLWRVEGNKVIITTDPADEPLIFTWEATLTDDCTRMENGQTIYHDGRDWQGSCWEATPG